MFVRQGNKLGVEQIASQRFDLRQHGSSIDPFHQIGFHGREKFHLKPVAPYRPALWQYGWRQDRLPSGARLGIAMTSSPGLSIHSLRKLMLSLAVVY